MVKQDRRTESCILGAWRQSCPQKIFQNEARCFSNIIWSNWTPSDWVNGKGFTVIWEIWVSHLSSHSNQHHCISHHHHHRHCDIGHHRHHHQGHHLNGTDGIFLDDYFLPLLSSDNRLSKLVDEPRWSERIGQNVELKSFLKEIRLLTCHGRCRRCLKHIWSSLPPVECMYMFLIFTLLVRLSRNIGTSMFTAISSQSSLSTPSKITSTWGKIGSKKKISNPPHVFHPQWARTPCSPHRGRWSSTSALRSVRLLPTHLPVLKGIIRSSLR